MTEDRGAFKTNRICDAGFDHFVMARDSAFLPVLAIRRRQSLRYAASLASRPAAAK
jgi:hypothetical protein